ncbi:MAG: hypothetical protein WA738_14585 [Candidatus Angelobacter sp.]
MSSRPSGTIERWNRVLETLETVLAGPRWLRMITATVAVSLAFFGATVTVTELFNHIRGGLFQTRSSSEIYKGGTHDPTRDSPQAQSNQSVKQEQDELQHADWHHTQNDLLERHEFVNNAQDGELTVEAYKSDKCIWVHRVDYKHHLEFKKWIHSDVSSTSPITKINTLDWAPKFHDELKIAGIASGINLSPASGRFPALTASLLQPGRCLNPHPGAFRYWWGPPNGCWVPFNRQFADGCHHIQLFNSCANVWDSRIQWDTCFH